MIAFINTKRFSTATTYLAIALVMFVAGIYFTPTSAQDNQPPLTTLEQTYAEVYDRVSPSVVSIEVDERGATANSFIPLSSGSGFVIDTQGHIVTNFHVIDDADRIAINFFDGTITRADIVGVDPSSDLAVLRVDLPADRLFPVTFGDSDSLVIGQRALAIGSPFGERWTLTAGIVSALDRTLEAFTSFTIGGVIQTDTPINPGNSGGPLLNLAGEVIGVNSQIVSQNRANSGVGFAVPSNLTIRVAEELISSGRVNYSYLGVNGEEINIDFIERYALPNDVRGVVITRAVDGAPAAQGGLRTISNSSVDVVTAIDGRPVMNMSMLIGYLASNTAPGQTVTMTIYRDGALIDLNITLASRPR